MHGGDFQGQFLFPSVDPGAGPAAGGGARRVAAANETSVSRRCHFVSLSHSEVGKAVLDTAVRTALCTSAILSKQFDFSFKPPIGQPLVATIHTPGSRAVVHCP